MKLSVAVNVILTNIDTFTPTVNLSFVHIFICAAAIKSQQAVTNKIRDGHKLMKLRVMT